MPTLQAYPEWVSKKQMENYIDEVLIENIDDIVEGNGVTVTSGVGTVTIAAKAGTGITVNSNGINVDSSYLNNTIESKVKDDLDTLVVGSTSVTATPHAETGVITLSVNEDWVDSKVAAATIGINAGNGIDLSVSEGTNTLAVKPSTGISVDTDGVAVDNTWLEGKIAALSLEGVDAGNGIIVSASGERVGVSVKANTGISVTAEGVSVNSVWLDEKIADKALEGVSAGTGITVTASGDTNTIAVKEGVGITVNTTGVNVDESYLNDKLEGAVTAGTGISLTAGTGTNTVGLDTTYLTNSINTAVTNKVDDGLYVAGKGVTVSTASGIGTIAAKAGTGITVNNSGINVNTTWLQEQIPDVTAGTGISVSGSTVSVNETWLQGQIEEQAPTTTLTSGTGISVSNVNNNYTVNVNSTWLQQQMPDIPTVSAGTGISVSGSTDYSVSVNESWVEDKINSTIDQNFYLPIYTTVTDGEVVEVHTVLPDSVTTVKYTSLEADGAGTSGLTMVMKRDIGSKTSMNITASNANCAAYAGYAVTFTFTGCTNQTEIAAMVVFA